MSTGIQWTDETWNPIIALDRETGKRGWFCTHASTGCVNCYAEGMNRFRGNGHLYRVPELEHVEISIHEETLLKPLHWRKPRKIFVCSMADLFFESHTDAMIDRVFVTMARCPQHTFQVLTKRARRMREYCNARALGLPLPNVWLGVSAENQATADLRIPELMQTPATVRWVSAEPLLEAVDFTPWLPSSDGFVYMGPERGPVHVLDGAPSIDWIVAGGESGAKARPFSIDWARSIIAQCAGAGAACFVKQLGTLPIMDTGEWEQMASSGPAPLLSARNDHRAPAGTVPLKLYNRHGGNWAEWPEDLRVRQFPQLEHRS